MYARVLLALGSLAVLLTYFLPLWEIKLWAPQYPEGLSIEIWHNDVKGDVEIINGLNHYIGMRHIKPEMFPEFMVLKYIIAAFIIWGLFVAFKGSLKWLKLYCGSILAGGAIALLDFYKWGYDYGHNLDPTAPIQVPGMAYQPPVIGYKTLLNFVALSTPSTGGWIVVGLGVLAFILLAIELFKKKQVGKIASVIFIIGAFSSLTSCSEVIPVIRFGTDDCDHCRMKIMDNKFGFALVTEKGKVYKFDDMNCIAGFKKDNPSDKYREYVITFDNPGKLIPASSAYYLQSTEINSPMGSGVAAFSSMEQCKTHENTFHTTCLTYNGVQNR